MTKVSIYVQTEDEDLLPSYATGDSAGADIRAAIDEPVIIEPGQTKLIPAGIKIETPAGFEVQVRPRSGLALKHQITVLNTPGTIDSDYRGPIGVILTNHGNQPFEVLPKMRIAQMIVMPVLQANFERRELLSETVRGEGGFGHTGVH